MAILKQKLFKRDMVAREIVQGLSFQLNVIPHAPPVVIPEYRTKSDLWTLIDVTHKQNRCMPF